MRIAFVSFETVHHRDGEANERLQTTAELLRDADHEVHVLCARWWDGEEPTFERDGITYHGLAPDLTSRRSFSLRLPITLRSLDPAVVHASAEPPTQVQWAGRGSALARAPLVVDWYDDGGSNDWHARRAASRPQRIVTPSQLVRTWVRELGADGDQVEVIPNPIDVDRIRSIDPGEPVDVVYARHLDDDANLESLLLGLAELRSREWSAVVLGDGPERGAYEALAEDLRIDDRVRFAGEVSLEERIATYRSAHVFAQTARRCVYPTELLWALACGCVGIVEYHADSSAHELVERLDRGFRVTSEQQLVDAISAAGGLERRDYDEQFERFDRDAVCDQYLESYREIRDGYELSF
ncbi:glycosyltransferase family 4 protein [Natronobeatus ordinarius]|uniref:glycosyltransferase family 4 protein n=1 Tax=Natronobeatus ordinarius TaxID=2963433 RepID=UPI0020CC6373|nr:glycosyltransferase family 4 protein [Natronobeatus ordinarius]